MPENDKSILEALVEKASADGETFSYEKNDVIYSQGGEAKFLYQVLLGEIKLVVVSSSGKEAIVGLVEAPGFFGENSLTALSRRPSR